jgi:glucose-1-phosphate thymidylyltransferase
MKGIILSGGLGTRLHPLTLVISKQLLPVYDKPMIYYPLSCLLLAGIREILIISTPRDTISFKTLLGDGASLGCKFSYLVQDEPSGLPQAFVLGEKFIGDDKVALILGDNIFHDSSLGPLFQSCYNPIGGTVFAYQVVDPSQYGVVEFDSQLNVISIEEKPKVPRSKYALVGVYFFDNDVIEIAKGLTKSARGEYEIIDVCKEYLNRGKLNVKILARGTVWLDSGTFGSLMQASNYVQTIEERQGLKIGCIEEIAYRMGYIDAEQLRVLGHALLKSGYGQYLLNILKE